MEEFEAPQRTGKTATIRIVSAFAIALAFALGVYLLINAVQPDALVSFTFLLILPAAISAFVAYVADPFAERSYRFYMMIPFWILLAVVIASIVFLAEGIICIILLAPLWLGSGIMGTHIAYRMRSRTSDHNTTYSSALLLMPMLAMQIEAQIPLPRETTMVTRSIVINAAPEKIWPLLRGIPDVRPGEGAWNLSQDVIGLPRPIGARLVGNGIGADRFADWGERIKFRERITQWVPGRVIGWRFIFDDVEGWKFTDRHLMPNSPYFTVTTGGYRMEPLPDGKTRLTLETNYEIQTPVNLYSRAWGEFFLGDVHNNLLAIIKGRAEAQQ